MTLCGVKGLKIRTLTFFYFFIIIITLSNVSYSENFPRRIVSLSPSITEIIYGLGAWENVVGVTIYSDFPPEAKNLPKVGGWVNPNLEAILALKPDLVIMIEDQDRIFGDKIRKIGLKTLAVESNNTIKDISNSISKIGKTLGKEKEAHKVIEILNSNLEQIRNKTNNANPKRVLFIVGRNPGTLEDIYVIGSRNFIDEIITLSGGENVVSTYRFSIKISKEAILSLNPEVIIEVNHENINKNEALKIWDGLKEVSAVKNKEFYIIADTTLLHPSQRISEGARILAEILHPEVVTIQPRTDANELE
ncbi:MAG: Periplasmic binding protein, iron complex transport system substrate-binding protein [Candidatus Dadabacteria bacterium]|nr:Periplasmic binding protein, iron complex transport system substrate-binding protein [Candidatus Dadabacteria bacterium]